MNARWGFCVDYPGSWKASEPPDGSGIDVYPYATEKPSSATYISIRGLPDQPTIDNANVVLDDSPPLNLEGKFTRTLGSLREYDHASDMRVIEKGKLEFQGYDARKTKLEYRGGPNATLWSSETLWVNNRYIIFTASLFGRPEQIRDLDPVYQDILKHRFQLVCGREP